MDCDSISLNCSDFEDDTGEDDKNIVKTEESEHSDEDDDINVIIQPLSRDDELRRINLITSRSDEVYPTQDFDLELERELQTIVSKTIILNSKKCITVSFQNQIILIPNDMPISSKLASLLWENPKRYAKMTLPSQTEFDKNMQMCRSNNKFWTKAYPDGIPFSSKIGIFAVKYKKNVIAPNVTTNTTTKSGSQIEGGFKHSNSGVYQYYDFALLIVENCVIIDYAIHGFSSNINECIKTHQPVKIFYNAEVGDALDVFMNYPYQPFFEATSGLLRPIKIQRLTENFNSLSFCPRHDIFCASCSALKDFRGLMFQLPQQTVINNFGQKLNYMHRTSGRPYKANLAKNQFGQPMHNAHQITLYRAPKNQSRFKPYLNR